MLLFTKPKTRVGDITKGLIKWLKLEGVDDVLYSQWWNADVCDALCNCTKPFRLVLIQFRVPLHRDYVLFRCLTAPYICQLSVTPSTPPFQSADRCGARWRGCRTPVSFRQLSIFYIYCETVNQLKGFPLNWSYSESIICWVENCWSLIFHQCAKSEMMHTHLSLSLGRTPLSPTLSAFWWQFAACFVLLCSRSQRTSVQLAAFELSTSSLKREWHSFMQTYYCG